MLEVKQHGDKWRLHIKEVWEFDSVSDLKVMLLDIISWKAAYGQLKENEKHN